MHLRVNRDGSLVVAQEQDDLGDVDLDLFEGLNVGAEYCVFATNIDKEIYYSRCLLDLVSLYPRGIFWRERNPSELRCLQKDCRILLC